jgi:hypothetical protein
MKILSIRVTDQRNMRHKISKRKVNWIGHILQMIDIFDKIDTTIPPLGSKYVDYKFFKQSAKSQLA